MLLRDQFACETFENLHRLESAPFLADRLGYQLDLLRNQTLEDQYSGNDVFHRLKNVIERPTLALSHIKNQARKFSSIYFMGLLFSPRPPESSSRSNELSCKQDTIPLSLFQERVILVRVCPVDAEHACLYLGTER